MTQLITVTYDGKVLKPTIPLNLNPDQEYQIQLISNNLNNNNQENDEELEQLHHQFDWLIADLGVNQPLTRSKAYQD
jgi:predicted DNA-binding antitoxin AbrB/MazE fold protein